MTKRELLIVIAVLVVIAAIAVPNLLNHAQYANEYAAVVNLRRIANAQEQYKEKYGVYGTLPQLHGEDSRIDSILAEGRSPGYFYTINRDRGNHWCCVARPTIWDKRGGGATGAKNFMVGKDAVVYYNDEENGNDFIKKVEE